MKPPMMTPDLVNNRRCNGVLQRKMELPSPWAQYPSPVSPVLWIARQTIAKWIG